jgi:hypothetical protein
MTGSISIGEELSPIQLFMKEWFFTCYSVGTTFLFCTQGIALFAFIALSQRRKRSMEAEAESSSIDLGSDVASQGDIAELDI